MYFPVGKNVTSICVVNNTLLFWVVEDFKFDISQSRRFLHSGDIFRRPDTSEGTMKSALNVFGDIEMRGSSSYNNSVSQFSN